ncbi:hypothetical protein D3C78_940380 [compost metagenome]
MPSITNMATSAMRVTAKNLSVFITICLGKKLINLKLRKLNISSKVTKKVIGIPFKVSIKNS